MEKQEIQVVDETTEMELPRLSTGDLDLDRMPERIDNTVLAAIANLAKEPLPNLPPCDEQTFGQSLRMMLAALPRRQSDDLSGELFVAAYERQLGDLNKSQVEFLLDESLRRCRWFPTISECLEILGEWKRSDEYVARRTKAKRLIAREMDARDREKPWPRSEPPVTQSQIEQMPESLRQLGITCGALVERDGKIEAA